MREAVRELVDEGLLIVRPYAGTQVIRLSPKDVHEIHSMRIGLESFAFGQAWAKRDAKFVAELDRRHHALIAVIDAPDEPASIASELEQHALVYETAAHELLIKIWSLLRGRLQLYWMAHHQAHGRLGPRRDSHVAYVAAVKESDLITMLNEVRRHMGQASERTEAFLLKSEGVDQTRTAGMGAYIKRNANPHRSGG